MTFRRCIAGLGFAGFALMLSVIVVCTGCRSDQGSDKKEADAKKSRDENGEEPKPDFEMPSLVTVPGDSAVAFPFLKPGHWFTVRHEVKANYFDFQGELWARTRNSTDQPVPVENTYFEMRSVRSAPLPKAQGKLLDTTYYVPRQASDTSVGVWMVRELRSARGGRLVKEDSSKLYVMPPYQYFMLVLAREPDRYGYLKQLTAVSAPTTECSDSDAWLYYRVLAPPVRRFVPLPSQSLTWSTLAYIVWDDLDPDMLTGPQRQALLDWLHWGGQLIINGPNSLEKMRGKFLDAYLPADPGPTVQLPQEALQELNDRWALLSADTRAPLPLKLSAGTSLVALELGKRSGTEILPGTSGLVMERRVGAGRVVVTAFSLTDRAVINWPSFDSFFNACVLRRPPRKFASNGGAVDTTWVDFHPSLASDSRLSTMVRYFARDIGHLAAGSPVPQSTETPAEKTGKSRRPLRGPRPDAAAPKESEAEPRDAGPYFGGYSQMATGVAAWNDRSGATDAARQALKDSAGISVPQGRFVLRVLLIYLLLLVPANWLFFRLLGHVEWAWFAAPVIAICAAVVVVRAAQLNIGFARSVTEVAIAECHAGYSRAHLTRYTALYSSLSTTYDVDFDRADALIQPLGAATSRSVEADESFNVLTIRRDQGLHLQGFKVSSNSTSILHCEQMSDLGGSFVLSGDPAAGFVLQNKTRLNAQGIGVLRRELDGTVLTSWVGSLPRGAKASLDWRPAPQDLPHLSQWDDSPATASGQALARKALARLDSDGDGKLSYEEAVEYRQDFRRSDGDHDGLWNLDELTRWCQRANAGEVPLGQLVELASRKLELARGDMRLIGWVDGTFPGMKVSPGAAQHTARTMLLVHLKQGPLPAPRPDRNRQADVAAAPSKDG
jgi:hypothetical protein